MKTVTQIQSGMRFNGAEDSITVTEGEGLENLNRIYRKMASMLPWPELTREDTSITTDTSGRHNWLSSVVFLDVKLIEVQDGGDGNRYKAVWSFADYNSLNKARQKNAQAVPDGYWRFYTGTTHQVEFAPVPKYGGKTVRVTGVIEPDELTDGNDQTLFLQRAADDAIEHMLAGMYYERDGFYDRANAQFKNAQELFQRLFGKELVPDELVRRIVPPQ